MSVIRSVFYAILWVTPWTLGAQSPNLGLPPVTHFLKTTYRAGTQSWDFGQDARGVIFFANNEGLLSYNGAVWTLYPISNKTCVRALLIGADQRIYVGGQGEIGYFVPNTSGALTYHSLNDRIDPAARNFADVWDIVFFDNNYFFRTSNRVFCLGADGRMTTVFTGRSLEYLGAELGGLYVHDATRGLYRYSGGAFTAIAGAKPSSVVTAMLPWDADTVLVATLKHGLFSLVDGKLTPWQTPCDAFFREKRIYTAALLKNRKIAVGTTLGGLVVLEPNRRPFLWLRKGAGLQHNNILCVQPDAAGNLWLGLDNGIDYVEINAPFYRIIPDGELEGSGYVARVAHNRLYLGTSNGLYQLPWKAYYDPFSKQQFTPVQGTTGQVWGLNEYRGTLLLGHHEGAFQVSDGQARPLNTGTGVWKFVPVGDSLLIAGQYDGLAVYAWQNGGWRWQRKIPGLDESCRILEAENDSILWVSHPYRGVFQVQFDGGLAPPQVRLFGRQSGLPSDLFNYVFKVGGRPVIAAEHRIFRFDPAEQRFAPVSEFDAFFDKNVRTRYLCEDSGGNIWFVSGDQTGVLWVRDEGLGKRIRKQLFPQLNGQMVGGFETIYPGDAQNLFFGVETGFMHLAVDRLQRADSALQVVIGTARLPLLRDSLLFGGFGQVQVVPELAYAQGSLRLTFSATVFGESRRIEYSSQLEGLDETWSSWSAKTERDFARLPPGNYRFLVKARDETGRESAPAVFEWVVLPPWYASPLAYGVYALLAIAALLAFARLQRRRFEREKAELTQRHRIQEAAQRQRAEQSEQAYTRLENEKLEDEIKYKNKELALATMHLVQKGELIAGIQEALERVLEREPHHSPLRSELQRVLRMLQLDARTDQDWEQFALHFDQVYGDFLMRLRDQYPQLSPNDYRLCAYLRMNLNTKEIAHLMNISVRGVEGSRYRLRRKLGLDNQDNLVDFLMQV